MVNPIDALQNKKIKGLFYLIAAMGAATTLFVYYEKQKAKPELEKLKELEIELKSLQLQKLKSEKKKGEF